MPRKISREFCLDRAIRLFSAHGYRGTSMEMLAKSSRVAKPSLYANFGSKKALFLEALGDHNRLSAERISSLLGKGVTVRDGLAHLLGDPVVPRVAKDRRQRTTTHSVYEPPCLDIDIEVQVRKAVHEVIRLLTEGIRRGQQGGEFRNDRPAAELALFIMSILEGTRVLHGSNVDMSHRAGIAELVLSVLDRAVEPAIEGSPAKAGA